MAKYTFGFKCTFKNRLRGSTSTVLTAMALLMGDSNFRPPPTEYTHPLTDTKEFVTGDYVGGHYGCAKFDANPPMGASG